MDKFRMVYADYESKILEYDNNLENISFIFFCILTHLCSKQLNMHALVINIIYILTSRTKCVEQWSSIEVLPS